MDSGSGRETANKPYDYEGPHEEIVGMLDGMRRFVGDGLRPLEIMHNELAPYLSNVAPLNDDEVDSLLDVIPKIAEDTTQEERDRMHLKRGILYWFGYAAVESGENQRLLVERIQGRIQRLGVVGMVLSRNLELK